MAQDHGTRTGYAAGAHNRLREDEKRRYIALIAKGHTKLAAAEACGRRRSTFNDERLRDPEFAAEVDEAYHADGRDTLVEVARCRAVDGWDEAVFQKGELVGYVRKYDHRLLELLIKQRDPSFRDRVSVEQSGPGGGPIEVTHGDSIDAEIRRLLGEMDARDEAGDVGAAAPGAVAEGGAA